MPVQPVLLRHFRPDTEVQQRGTSRVHDLGPAHPGRPHLFQRGPEQGAQLVDLLLVAEGRGLLE
ncbi:hypothetical protein [Nocardia sp. NPDC057455]|uniref:hypothetical protein n=1 Tax=Nocardia sp. NPDC057455 TaxID=3346138 RepID=UPI00367018ED